MVFLLSFITAAGAYANAISFQIVQHDASQEKVRNASYEIENTLMEYFFDAGYIVTNSPTVATASKEADDAAYHKAINDALDGQCDIFISVITEYDVRNSTGPELSLLSNIAEISWKVINVTNGKQIASGKQKTGKVTPENDTEDGIVRFASDVAAKINSSIKSIQ